MGKHDREAEFRNRLRATLGKLDAEGMREILTAIVETLYPEGNPDAEWSADTTDRIAQILRAWDLCSCI